MLLTVDLERLEVGAGRPPPRRRLRRGTPLLRRARARRARGRPRPRPRRRCASARTDRCAARARAARLARRDAAGRRLPAALRGRQLRPRDLLRGDGARARLPRARRASSRAWCEPGGTRGRHDPDRDQRAALPAARRRLLRVARAATSASSARAISRAALARRRARADRRRLRPRAATRPYWALRSVVGLPRADDSPPRARLPAVPDPRDDVAAGSTAREMRSMNRLPEEPGPVREATPA